MRSFLFINTSEPAEIAVGVRQGKHTKWVGKKAKAQEVLKLIDNLAGSGRSGVCGIAVKTGAGTFTGIRIGAAVANAIGFVLGVPVVGTEGDLLDRKVQDQVIAELRKGVKRRLVAPTYSEPPRVTMKL